MAILLALIAAIGWGISDFLGGALSKRHSAWVTAFAVQAGSLAATVVATRFFASQPSPSDWAWGAAAGLGVGAGTAFLYRGLTVGRMGVVAPLSAVGAAVVPVAVGLTLGERPGLTAMLGIAVALPAIWLIAGAPTDTEPGTVAHRGVTDAALAGLSFGSGFVCVDHIRPAAGLDPLIASQIVSLVPVIALAVLARQPFWPRSRSAWTGAALGPLGLLANACLLWALQLGMLSVVSVLTSLYPASTVVLAALVLRERIHVTQGIGLALAALAVALISLPPTQ